LGEKSGTYPSGGVITYKEKSLHEKGTFVVWKDCAFGCRGKRKEVLYQLQKINGKGHGGTKKLRNKGGEQKGWG